MAVPALIDIDGLEARGADVSNVPRALAAIDDASALVHDATDNRWITTDGEVDPTTPSVVFTITYKVARRAISNNDGIASEQLGPYQTTYRDTEGAAYLTADERAMLAGTTGTSSSGLSSVRLEAPWPVFTRCADLDEEDDEEA